MTDPGNAWQQPLEGSPTVPPQQWPPEPPHQPPHQAPYQPSYQAPYQPPYQGPPLTAPHDPGSAVPPHPQAYSHPYNNPYGQAYGQPYPGGYGYPAVPPGLRRPGILTAAAVLGYVTAGLLVIAGLLLFTGASLVSSIDASSEGGLQLDNFTAELTFDGFLNLLAAGLLIAGGVIMSSRRPNGRALYSSGAMIVVFECIYWLTRWGPRVNDASGMVSYALLFGALAVVGLVLACTRDASTWLSGRPPAQPHPG